MKKIIVFIIAFISIFFISDNVYAFELINPVVTMVETSTEIQSDANYTINNTSPSLSYGTATYNYIFNQFIPNKLYSSYGKYYICGGSGTAYTSSCYISDSPDAFVLKYAYSGSSASPSMTYFNVYVNPTEENKVYKYTISSGSKSSSSAYITSLTQVVSLYGSFNNGIYAPTNLPYLKMGDSSYNTIKTADGYMFNNGDILLYFNDTGEIVLNTKYIDSSGLEPYKAKRSIEFNTGISSFDIYVDKDDNLTDLTYKINYVDYNDYTIENITKSKLYTVMFYGLKNENGLYHWEMLDDCTNWDYPSEYCHVKSKFEQLESELNKEGFTVEGYVDFLDVFNQYDTVRVVLRLDNALTGKIDYWDKNMKISATDVDVNYFGFDYSRNLSDSDLYRYTIFSTKEKDLSGNLYIISQSKDITINYFDTKYANFKEYSYLADVKKQENFWLFNYENIGLDKNLGFYLFTERNLTERLVYQFYTNTGLYFSYNDSDTLDGTIYIDNTGNSTNSDIAIDPDELMNYEYETIDDLFENITKFNEKINVVSQEIHKVIQYAYDSLNIYIKSFLISIFTVILVSGTIVLIRR